MEEGKFITTEMVHLFFQTPQGSQDPKCKKPGVTGYGTDKGSWFGGGKRTSPINRTRNDDDACEGEGRRSRQTMNGARDADDFGMFYLFISFYIFYCTNDYFTNTVPFRSICPSRVTRQVVLDEIGCLSHVTRRVVGFEKPLAKWSKNCPNFFSSPVGAYVLM
jgi:hypothetical protein